MVNRELFNIIDNAFARTEGTDFKLWPLNKSNCIRIRLLLNTDGSVNRKSASESAYPVWLSLANLPPILKTKFENIILGSVWYGRVETPGIIFSNCSEKGIKQVLL